jgi:hypothetical protein
MTKAYVFTRSDEKKHSVVYKCVTEEGDTFSVYVPKSTGLTENKKLKMTLEETT